MTGIVVVSHSAALATAAIDLAREMAGEVRMVAAAGIPDGFGTDATTIAGAIQEADDGQGVVVLMDLGSAILSSEMALEFLDDDLRKRVILCAAPFVEGLVAAGVAAAGGAAPDEVRRKAESALEPKRADIVGESTDRTFVLASGLHARPAARLVAALQALNAVVELRNITRHSAWVDGGSVTGVALLGGARGDEIEVRASGDEAEAAIATVASVLTNNAPIVRGTVWQYRRQPVSLPPPGPDEQSRLDHARATAAEELRHIRDDVPDEVKEIFTAHLAFLDDIALVRRARVSITVGESAESAWLQATEATAADFARIADPYLRARAADVRAIGDSVLRALGGVELPAGHDVVIARELNPVEAATFALAGAVLTQSAATDHAVMILRARGIPTALNGDPSLLDIPDGATVTVEPGTASVKQ